MAEDGGTHTFERSWEGRGEGESHEGEDGES
jgi:hypothetical protein